MILLLEGPDRCGKTNIGQALSEVLDSPYFKVSSESRNWKTPGAFKTALEYDQTYLCELLEQTYLYNDYIIDRAYPSEIVYSKVFNRETNLNLAWDIDARLANIDATILLCTRRYGPENWDDELVDKSKFFNLVNEYNNFMDHTKCNIIRIFVDDYNCDLSLQIDPIVKAIVESSEGKNYKVTL